jgi:ketosteroid isomerase-like protein
MSQDFEEAAEAARQAYSADVWASLLPHERSKAIYRELSRIDMTRAKSAPPRRRTSRRALVSHRYEEQVPPIAAIPDVVGASIPVLPGNGDSMVDDEAKIRALEDRFAAAFSAKDVDAVMRVYVPDETLVVFDAASPREYVGAKAYRKDRKKFFAIFNGPVEFEISALNIATHGGLGFGHSIQHFGGESFKGRPIDLTVRVTDVYRKIDGDWLVVHEHVSVPVDFDTEKLDLSEKPQQRIDLASSQDTDSTRNRTRPDGFNVEAAHAHLGTKRMVPRVSG